MSSSASIFSAKASTCPEVSLVAILDADKEGFLRSAGSLIQTMGRAARHLEGRAILYADRITDSMRRAMDETDRRRVIQTAYNEEHGITRSPSSTPWTWASPRSSRPSTATSKSKPAAEPARVHHPGRSRCHLHRQARNRNARSRQEIRIRKSRQTPRLHQGTPRKRIPLRSQSPGSNLLQRLEKLRDENRWRLIDQ
jgi:hypothetical protein